MRHRKYSFKIGRTSAHRKALLANQVSSLILTNEIRTTVTKAKETRRVAEKMVTLAKKGTLHCRRRAISKLRDKGAVRILFSDIAPKYMERNGGYTRIIRLGQRRGDAAEICILQWVEEAISPKAKKKKTTVKAEDKKVAEGPKAEVKEEHKVEKKEVAKEEPAKVEEKKKEPKKAEETVKATKVEEKTAKEEKPKAETKPETSQSKEEKTED